MSSPTVGAIDSVVTQNPASQGDRLAHLSYIASLVLKGFLGLAQLTGGVLIYLAPVDAWPRLVVWLTTAELAEDPDDPFSRWFIDIASSAPADAAQFYAIYLLIHGVLNLGLVLALVARYAWAYPVSIAALAGFVGYQIYKFTLTSDPVMIVLSLIDVLVIWLIWRESQAMRRSHVLHE